VEAVISQQWAITASAAILLALRGAENLVFSKKKKK
jgi:hypothetical protein